jgi:hypothetical protein
MIDVNLPFSKKEFIEYLNNNNDIIHQIDITKQSKLYVKQQSGIYFIDFFIDIYKNIIIF